MKKLIILSLVGIGVYLILSKRKAFAEEIPEVLTEIPLTPSAPKNPAIDMVESIVNQAEISLPEVKLIKPPVIFIPEPAPEPVVPMTPEECRSKLLSVWRWPIAQFHLIDPCGMLKLVAGI